MRKIQLLYYLYDKFLPHDSTLFYANYDIVSYLYHNDINISNTHFHYAYIYTYIYDIYIYIYEVYKHTHTR